MREIEDAQDTEDERKSGGDQDRNMAVVMPPRNCPNRNCASLMVHRPLERPSAREIRAAVSFRSHTQPATFSGWKRAFGVSMLMAAVHAPRRSADGNAHAAEARR